jgi:hypothetical protein
VGELASLEQLLRELHSRDALYSPFVAALWAIFGLIDAEGAQAEQRANAEGTPGGRRRHAGGRRRRLWRRMGCDKKKGGIGWQGR